MGKTANQQYSLQPFMKFLNCGKDFGINSVKPLVLELR